MSPADLEAEVRRIVTAVLGGGSWDSLRHIQIIFAIEERFGVQFTEEDIPRLTSAETLTDAVSRRLTAA